MASEVGHFGDIDEVIFKLSLINLNNFKKFVAQTFHVRENPWKIRFYKIDDHLAVKLQSKIENKSKDWTIVTGFTVAILSNETCGNSFENKLQPHAFDSESLRWGINRLISWAKLIDPKEGYVQNGKCQMMVTLKVSPLQKWNGEKVLLELVSLRKCCDGGSKMAFQIKIHEMSNFNDLSSPEFIVKHFNWRLLVFKAPNDVRGFSNQCHTEDFLQIRLFNRSISAQSEFSCKMKLSCRLNSFDSNVQPIQQIFLIA